ncbi:hypothetical protein ROT00_00370 [Agromyces mediolanus]|uniref:hypothetical protein n=1 Tax=Agromyces mediolanus TaxID=41986 RepID=UPI003838E51D
MSPTQAGTAASKTTEVPTPPDGSATAHWLDSLRPAVSGGRRAAHQVEVDEFFLRGRRRANAAVAVPQLGLVLLGICVLVWELAGGTSAILGIPAALIAIATVGISMMAAIWTVPIWNPAERRLARQYGLPVYRVGSAPFSRTMLVVGETALVVLAADGAVHERWERAAIDSVGILRTRASVVLVVATGGRFFEISVCLRAFGPVASAWAFHTRSARRGLGRAIEDDLALAGYPTTVGAHIAASPDVRPQ